MLEGMSLASLGGIASYLIADEIIGPLSPLKGAMMSLPGSLIVVLLFFVAS